jgi:hypothetical protein
MKNDLTPPYDFSGNRDGFHKNLRDKLIFRLSGLAEVLVEYREKLHSIYPDAVFDVTLFRNGPPQPGRLAPLEIAFDMMRDTDAYEKTFNFSYSDYANSVRDPRIEALAGELLIKIESLGHKGYALVDILY